MNLRLNNFFINETLKVNSIVIEVNFLLRSVVFDFSLYNIYICNDSQSKLFKIGHKRKSNLKLEEKKYFVKKGIEINKKEN